MESTNISENKVAIGLTDEEIEFLSSSQEMGKAWEDIISFGIKAYSTEVDTIKEIYPQFKGKTLKQLNNDKDFQQALKEYRTKYPTPPTFTEPEQIKNILKSKIPENYYITNNKLSNEIIKDFVDQNKITLAIMNIGKKMKYEHITH